MYELKEYLNYNPDTGLFTWFKKPSKKIMLNSIAGYKNQYGYIMIMFKGKSYPAHRLAWFFIHNEIPNGYIDHINHIRDDNRISNLRLVTHQENCMNRKRRTGKVDEAGIWYCRVRQKYIAEIKLHGKKVYQRTFKDIDEAIKQRKAKLLELGFHPNHGDKQ